MALDLAKTRFVVNLFTYYYFFKVFIEFVTMLLLFYVSVFWPQGMWDLSSLTRDRTCTPCIGRRSLNRWTAREVPSGEFSRKVFCVFLGRDIMRGTPITMG